MANPLNPLSRWLLVIPMLAALGLAACGGGSGTGANSATGRVAVLLTDAPTALFQEVNVTITRVELLGEYGLRAELFAGNRTVNLLDLQNNADLFSVADNIPVGTYEKIRLTITGVELVRKDADGQVIEVVTPKIPANGKIDLNPRHHFTVNPGETLVLQIDVDAQKSIHVVALGNGGYRFRPVIFVDILSGGETLGRFVKLSGVVSAFDGDLQQFSLCRLETTFHRHHDHDAPASIAVGSVSDGVGDRDDDDGDYDDDGNYDGDHDDEHCVRVRIGDTTSLFNGNGPALIGDLGDGDEVTVVGRIDGRLDRDHDDDGYDHQVPVDALVIEIGPAGTFTRASGEVSTGYDAVGGQFEMVVNAPALDNPLAVSLLPGAYVLGRNGLVLAPADITAGKAARVSGLLAEGTGGPLAATVVYLQTEYTPVGGGHYSGVIADFDPESWRLTLQSQEIGDICVRIDTGADVYRISDGSSGQLTSEISPQSLVDGDRVDVYGHFDGNGCFEANDVIAAAAIAP